MKRRNGTRHGLTLLELLIVLTILVALGTLVVPSIGYLGRRSQGLTTRENLARLQDLLVRRYLQDMNELPRPAVDATGAVLETGSISGNRADHPQLRYLFVNPDTSHNLDAYDDFGTSGSLLEGRCWQGPYTLHAGAEYPFAADDSRGFTLLYGEPGDPVVLDAWGHPIVLQSPTETPDGVTDPDGIAEIQRTHCRLVSAGADGILDTPIDVLMPDEAERNDDVLVFLFRHDEFGDGYLDIGSESP